MQSSEESVARRVVHNSMSLVWMMFFSKGVRLLSMMIMVRFYDETAFGRFALIVATTELFRVVSEFGIDVTLTKWFVDPTRNRSEVQQAAVVLRIVLGALAAAMVVITAVILGYSGELFWGIVVGALSYFAVSLGNIWRAEWQADLKMGRIVRPTFLLGGLYLVGFTVGVAMRVSLPTLIAVGVVSDVLMFAVLVKGRHNGFWRKPSLARISDILTSCYPVGLLAILVVSYARVSTIIIAQVLGDVEVGQFTSALRITEGVLVFTGAFASSMLPIFSQDVLRPSGGELLELFISKYLRKLGVALIGLVMVLNLFSRDIISLLFTNQYAVAHQALAVLSWSVLFASFNMFFTNVLYAREQQKLLLWIGGANCVVNIILSVVLIERFGIVGAALAMVLTELMNMIAQWVAVLRISKMPFLQTISPGVSLRILGWLLVLLSVNVFLPEGLPTPIAGGVLLAYGVHVLLFKDLRLEEIRQSALALVSMGTK